MGQQRFLGRRLHSGQKRGKNPCTTVGGLVSVFRKETQRQKVMVKKAKLCEAKLMVLVTGFRRLLEDESSG